MDFTKNEGEILFSFFPGPWRVALGFVLCTAVGVGRLGVEIKPERAECICSPKVPCTRLREADAPKEWFFLIPAQLPVLHISALLFVFWNSVLRYICCFGRNSFIIFRNGIYYCCKSSLSDRFIRNAIASLWLD